MRTLILAGVLAAIAMAARADDDSARDANRADVRCILGMSVMGRNDTYKQWSQFGVFYYTGRLLGRDPGIDLAAAIKREVRQMAPGEYNGEIKRCSDALGETSRALEAMKPSMGRGVG
ncbi:hypothetical protein [Phenylobacterium sp.]|uniref:hypothetical protein n=1 Tax=Phenylobacterium sp. TaxID=1871053 RepID=UPI0025CC7675|nr:hypothetical protein [Phenylobacterium sp.]